MADTWCRHQLCCSRSAWQESGHWLPWWSTADTVIISDVVVVALGKRVLTGCPGGLLLTLGVVISDVVVVALGNRVLTGCPGGLRLTLGAVISYVVVVALGKRVLIGWPDGLRLTLSSSVML